MEISFRPAAPGDLQPLKDMARRVILANYTPFLGAELVNDFIGSGQADAEIDAGLDDCVLLTGDGAPLAFAVTRGELLHLMMVDVPHQRAGYGSLLMAHVERLLFARYELLRLQTFAVNRAAIRFYTKNGWQALPDADPDGAMLWFQKAKAE